MHDAVLEKKICNIRGTTVGKGAGNSVARRVIGNNRNHLLPDWDN